MRRRWGSFTAAYLVVGLLGALPLAAAQASVGSDPFSAGQAYHGDFPDPSVLRVGSTYYAYSTTTANMNLPVMTSTDLRTWRPGPEGMQKAASWARVKSVVKGKSLYRTWAPSVARVGTTYLQAYATELASTPGKMCIGLARSAAPGGNFVDAAVRPLVCPSDEGAIDPMVFVDTDGGAWLIWKTQGIPNKRPTRLLIRQLGPAGAGFASGSKAHTLLSTALPWEGTVIENPAMVDYRGHYYLFYSANGFATSRYAIGYALCDTVTGPCTRPSPQPLLATGGSVAGPGGPSPVVGGTGRLRLAYAAWDAGHVGYPTSTACRKTAAGCNQRRLHVATLGVLADGTLTVSSRG